MITKLQKKTWVVLTIILWATIATVSTVANWSVLPIFISLCACKTSAWIVFGGYIANAIVSFLISGAVVALIMFSLARWIIPAGLFILARRNSKK